MPPLETLTPLTVVRLVTAETAGRAKAPLTTALKSTAPPLWTTTPLALAPEAMASTPPL